MQKGSDMQEDKVNAFLFCFPLKVYIFSIFVFFFLVGLINHLIKVYS